jgi:hypothetical protein
VASQPNIPVGIKRTRWTRNELLLELSGQRLGSLRICGRYHGREYATVRQDAEESLPARVATIGGKLQKALHKEKRPFFNPFPRDPLQIEIPAFRTMSVSRKRNRNTASVKTPAARVASPGSQSSQCEEKIDNSPATGSKAIRTSALRTDHIATIDSVAE